MQESELEKKIITEAKKLSTKYLLGSTSMMVEIVKNVLTEHSKQKDEEIENFDIAYEIKCIRDDYDDYFDEKGKRYGRLYK